MSLHRCTEPECPFVGQTTSRSCRCHKTDEKMLAERVAELVAALEEAREFINDHVDVVDGDYGVPEPNRAMRLLPEIDAALSKEGR